MPKHQRANKLAVILRANVAGSTQLVRLREQLAHERIRQAFHSFAEFIERFQGRLLEVRCWPSSSVGRTRLPRRWPCRRRTPNISSSSMAEYGHWYIRNRGIIRYLKEDNAGSVACLEAATRQNPTT
jgi:class 3 adenylate cyclase